MTKINVSRAFSVRFSLKAPAREFAPGVHDLTEAEAANPFVRRCIDCGLAAVMVDGPAPVEPETPATEADPATETPKKKGK